MTLGLLIPAAGASSRMGGRDKLLEQIDGTPLLLRQLRVTLSVGLPVLVTLPTNAPNRATLIARPALCKTVTNASTGMSASLATGAEWALENAFSGVMVILPDLPDVTASDLATLVQLHEAHPNDVLRATSDTGQMGHPTVIPARLFAAMRQLTGDTGARDLLKQEKVRPCLLAGNRAVTDLDTPEAWAAWRATRG